MLRTFNCGVGLILIVSPSDLSEVMSLLVGEKASVIGQVESLPSGGKATIVIVVMTYCLHQLIVPLCFNIFFQTMRGFMCDTLPKQWILK